jgi:2-polyprenyl-6-methoxyphenol hydroxylase-like FAD-dependent oxidoreductase
MAKECEVLIVGAGIGGLTLALSLQQAGISCRIYEAVSEIKPLGAGVNLLPHAVRVLDGLGLVDQLAATAITTRESIFFNKFGQFVFSEPAGRHAGYDWPQFSIHRGDLQSILIQAVQQRLGQDAVVLGHRCDRVDQDSGGVNAYFGCLDGGPAKRVRASVLVDCEGIHSVVRKQMYPEEGPPRHILTPE